MEKADRDNPYEYPYCIFKNMQKLPIYNCFCEILFACQKIQIFVQHMHNKHLEAIDFAVVFQLVT